VGFEIASTIIKEHYMNEKINVRERWGAKIAALWDKYKNKKVPDAEAEIIKRGAFVQDTLWTKSILFVGIGASWGDGILEYVVQDGDIQYETEKGRDKWAYYKPLRELAEYVGPNTAWSHIDITLLRETNQDRVEPFYSAMPDFMREQFELALEMAAQAEPWVIVVNNAFVSRLLRGEIKPFPIAFKSEFDEDIGVHRIKAPTALENIPVFYTGMLSGQRALDIGSRERLFWHVKNVFHPRNRTAT
jgi:hypothetical protein